MSANLFIRAYWKQFGLAVLVSTFLAVCWLASHYHAKALQLTKDARELSAQVTSQQAIITKQIQQAQQFNAIAAGVESDKQQTTDTGDKIRLVYKTKMASSPCTVVPVSSDVSNGLYEHASKVRSGPGNANTGKPDR
jgi:outer membrane murein-binding lipoprotein Lpp